MTTSETADMASDGAFDDSLSRNPITGLAMLCDSSAYAIAKSKLGLVPSAQSISLTLRIVGDLALDADRLAAAEGQTVPSFVEATSGLVAKPAVVQNQHKRTQPVLTVCDFSSIFDDTTVTNMQTYIDRWSLAPALPRPAHDALLDRILRFVDYLRAERPAEVAADADIVAADLEGGAVEILRAGSRLGHCFMTPSAATAVSGELVVYALRWGLAGKVAIAQQAGNTAVAILGCCFPLVGAVSAIKEGTSLLQLIRDAQLGPKELPAGSDNPVARDL